MPPESHGPGVSTDPPALAALDPIGGLVIQAGNWWASGGMGGMAVQPCGNVHRTHSWLINCSCKPSARELIEAARATSLVDETGADTELLELLAHAYYETWVIHDQQHVEQWPLALVLLATLRRAGYDIRKAESDT